MLKCLNNHYGQSKKARDQTLDVAVDLGEVAKMNEAEGQQIQVESPLILGGSEEVLTGDVGHQRDYREGDEKSSKCLYWIPASAPCVDSSKAADPTGTKQVAQAHRDNHQLIQQGQPCDSQPNNPRTKPCKTGETDDSEDEPTDKDIDVRIH